jgi:hypothetical protein
VLSETSPASRAVVGHRVGSGSCSTRATSGTGTHPSAIDSGALTREQLDARREQPHEPLGHPHMRLARQRHIDQQPVAQLDAEVRKRPCLDHPLELRGREAVDARITRHGS